MSQAVELARSLRRDGLTLQKIVEVFKAQGIQSRRGKTPSVMTISRWCVGIPRPPHPTKGKKRKSHVPRSSVYSKEEVAKIRKLREEGYSIREIAEVLPQRYPEVKTSKGRSLAHAQIYRLLEK